MMKRPFFLLAVAALTVCGCARNYHDVTQYSHTGKLKPIVAVLPVIDSSNQKCVSWDLSNEFSDELRNRLAESSRVYLLRDEKGSLASSKTLNEALPTAIGQNMVTGFSPAEFLIVTELLEQNITPYGIASNCKDKPFIAESGAMLTLSMRVRVIDIRKDNPEVILQEVVDTDYNITRPYLFTDYSRFGWGTDAFAHTPIGIAHAKLVKDVLAHIEGYIAAR